MSPGKQVTTRAPVHLPEAPQQDPDLRRNSVRDEEEIDARAIMPGWLALEVRKN